MIFSGERRSRGPRPRPARWQPRVEGLEARALLATGSAVQLQSVLNRPFATADVAIPGGKTTIVPITATGATNQALAYTVTSSAPQQIAVASHAGNPFLKLAVSSPGNGISGDLVFQLLPDRAPSTVQTITGLVNQGFYNGLTFHRVVNDFVIQGGDPNGNGTGGPGFQFDDEFHPSAIFSGSGQLAMANSGKDTNGSQFFITDGPQRHLDFNHTIFGQLVRGWEVYDAIEAVPKDGSGMPSSPVVISSASIVTNPHDAVFTLRAADPTATATITVTATDPQGNSDTKTFTARGVVDATNDPPILGAVPTSLSTTPGTPVQITLSSVDLEGNPVIYGAAAQGATAQANATVGVNGNVVTVTPKAGYTGPLKIIVGVMQQGATARGSTTSSPWDTQVLTVNVANAPTNVLAQGVEIEAAQGQSTGDVPVATFTTTDANATAADFSATIDWGDGTAATPGVVAARAGGGFVVTGAHTYHLKGTREVRVTIRNADGTTALAMALSTARIRPGTAGDFNADGKADLGVYYAAGSEFYVRDSQRSVLLLRSQLGGWGNVPVSADFDGDGKTDVAVWWPLGRTFLVRPSSGGFLQKTLGETSSLPAVADYDGDGKADFAVYTPAQGRFTILRSSDGVERTIPYGGAEGIPVVADYDGDGKADPALYWPRGSTFYILGSSRSFSPITYGTFGNVPVVADYDGDGKADIAVYWKEDSRFFAIKSSGGSLNQKFGSFGNMPMPADYDGDGKADLAVRWLEGHTFYVLPSRGGGVKVENFGGSGNLPLTATPDLLYRAIVPATRASQTFAMGAAGGTNPTVIIPLVTGTETGLPGTKKDTRRA